MRGSNRLYSFFKPPAREMRILALDWTRPKDPPMSLGHASIVANFMANKMPIKEMSTSITREDFSFEKVFDFLLTDANEKTDIAIGAFVWNEPYVRTILHKLKEKRFMGRIILGGPQISYVQQGIEDYYQHADVFIRGYAEQALVDLAKATELFPNISGVSFANKPSLDLQAIPDLELLPSPFLSGVIKPQPFIRLLTQMGCPFKCAFCQHREPNATMRRRHLGLSRIEAEAQWILENPVIKDIAVLDPTFNSGPNYLRFLNALVGYKGKISLQVRAEMIKPEFLEAIEKINETGRVVLEIGLQSIHQNELKLIDRPTNMKRVNRELDKLSQRKIEYEISLIFGLPNQTVDSFKSSIQFCKDKNPSTIYAFPLMLLRGTPLYENKARLGLRESSTESCGKIPRIQGEAGIPHVVGSPSFSYSNWQEMASLAESLHEDKEDTVVYCKK